MFLAPFNFFLIILLRELNSSSNGPDGKPNRVLKGTWVFKLKHIPEVLL